MQGPESTPDGRPARRFGYNWQFSQSGRPSSVRKWRNWQTRKPQELVCARQWRVKSSLSHHTITTTRPKAWGEGQSFSPAGGFVGPFPPCATSVQQILGEPPAWPSQSASPGGEYSDTGS